MCLDTGHWRFGTGEHPADAVRELGDRIWHVHFKDADAAVMERSRREGWHGLESTGHGVFSELGRGSVDFPAVLAALRETGYDGWIVVEQDILPGMGDPRASGPHRAYLARSGCSGGAERERRTMADRVRIGVVGTSWWRTPCTCRADGPSAGGREGRRRRVGAGPAPASSRPARTSRRLDTFRTEDHMTRAFVTAVAGGAEPRPTSRRPRHPADPSRRLRAAREAGACIAEIVKAGG